MSHQGGYAIVDVDEEELGTSSKPSGGPQGLEFQTFLGTTDTATSRRDAERAAPNVPYNPFNLAYYQTYFDVDTVTVSKRLGLAMIPREGFIQDTCEGQMDLYGPFWTLTTLILALYTTSTLTASITQYLANPGAHSPANLPLLSTAATIIYAYGLALPAVFWAGTRWLGVGSWGVAEAIGLYGYSLGVFIPISLLCLIPVGILRWTLVGAAAASSGFFLVRNIYPILASADNKLLRYLVIAVAVLHAAMALSLKVLFFSYAVGGVKVGPDPVGDSNL